MTEIAKKITSGTLRMARGMATVMGLAVILAVVLGVGSAALAAVPGDPFRLGQANVINTVSRLAGSTNSAMLRIDNNNAGALATALDLQVEQGKPPLKVNSGARVVNLNSDRLDGKDSTQFVQAGAPAVFAAGQIRSDGSIRGSIGALSTSTHTQTGFYCIGFSEPADPERLESAVVGLAGSPSDGRVFPRVTNGLGIESPCDFNELIILVTDAAGNPVDTRFSIVVP